jgi:hypothetical protein
MALVAAFDLDVIQLDAVNAFINVDLDEDVYISCPDGYKEEWISAWNSERPSMDSENLPNCGPFES